MRNKQTGAASVQCNESTQALESMSMTNAPEPRRLLACRQTVGRLSWGEGASKDEDGLHVADNGARASSSVDAKNKRRRTDDPDDMLLRGNVAVNDEDPATPHEDAWVCTRIRFVLSLEEENVAWRPEFVVSY